MAARTSLFRYALGDKTFDKLPPALRGLLGGGERRRYRGVCHVNRGSGFYQRLAGTLTGLPRKTLGEAPVVLEIVPQGAQEGWIRHFPGKRLTTMARPRRGLGKGRIRERSGAVTLVMKIKVDGEGITMRPESAHFFGLPLPGFLAPKIKSSIALEDNRILVDSDVHLGSGRLIRYRLILDPEPMSDEKADAAEEDAAPKPPAAAREEGPKPATATAPTAPSTPEQQRRAAEATAAARAKAASAPDDTDETIAIQASSDAADRSEDTAGDETIAVQRPPASDPDNDETVAVVRRPDPTPEEDEEDGPAPASPGQTTKPVSPSRRRPRRRQE